MRRQVAAAAVLFQARREVGQHLRHPTQSRLTHQLEPDNYSWPLVLRYNYSPLMWTHNSDICGKLGGRSDATQVMLQLTATKQDGEIGPQGMLCTGVVPSDTRHVRSSHAFKTASKTHLYSQCHSRRFQIPSSYLPPPPTEWAETPRWYSRV